MDAKYTHGINVFAAKVQAENPARPSFILCERGDSNPHDRSHWILSPARLPNSATLASKASTAISNNALALFTIVDAKNEKYAFYVTIVKGIVAVP